MITDQAETKEQTKVREGGGKEKRRKGREGEKEEMGGGKEERLGQPEEKKKGERGEEKEKGVCVCVRARASEG